MKKVRKAVIPAAGLGTRLFPTTRVIKKEFLPVVDENDIAKPVIQLNVEEAINAGAEEVCIIIQPGDEPLFRSYFSKLSASERKLLVKNERNEKLAAELEALSDRITYVHQEVQDGFGHAVYCAREWVNGKPFLLMLGDHIFKSTAEDNCARQLMNVFESQDTCAVSGVTRTPAEQLRIFGTVTGTWLEQEKGLFEITQLYEKPSVDYAREHLAMPGMPDDTYFCFFGMHVFSNSIFDMLEFHIKNNMREKNEFQLTSAQERLRQECGNYLGIDVKGIRFDTGVPEEYRKTIMSFAG